MKPFLLELDLSQVESRICYMLTRDPVLVRQAQSQPWEFNGHTETAQIIYGVEEPTPLQYYLGKKTSHGVMRGMQGKKLADELLKEGTVMAVTECDWLIQRFFETKPAIRDVYFVEVRQQVWDHRKLTNSFGRVIEWPFDRFGDDLYREAYSWPLQSDAADLINQQGLIPMYHWLKRSKMYTKIIAQVHDSLLFNTCIEEAYDVALAFRGWIAEPIEYPAGPLSVPVTFKIGKTWAGDHEWRKLPSRDEFNTKIQEIIND